MVLVANREFLGGIMEEETNAVAGTVKEEQEEIEEEEEAPRCNICGTKLVTYKPRGEKGPTTHRCPKCKKFVGTRKKEEVSEVEFLETGEALFRLVGYFPSTIFTLYHYARANGLSHHEDIVNFIVEYAEYGFMKAHNLALTLSPLKSDGDNQKEIDELKETLANLKSDVEKLTSRRRG